MFGVVHTTLQTGASDTDEPGPMPNTQLRIDLPQETWIHEVSHTFSETVFRVIAVLSGVDTGIALLELTTPNPLPILTDIDEQRDVSDMELLWKQDDTTVIQVETTNPLLLSPIIQAGVPLQTPFEIINGVSTWELTTSSDRLSALGRQLEQSGIGYDIEYIHDEPSDSAETILTDRQRELVVTATEQGYYDTPRRATLTEVSNSLDISKATGSDILHRAEGKVMKWFIQEYLHPT